MSGNAKTAGENFDNSTPAHWDFPHTDMHDAQSPHVGGWGPREAPLAPALLPLPLLPFPVALLPAEEAEHAPEGREEGGGVCHLPTEKTDL